MWRSSGAGVSGAAGFYKDFTATRLGALTPKFLGKRVVIQTNRFHVRPPATPAGTDLMAPIDQFSSFHPVAKHIAADRAGDSRDPAKTR